jgi:proline dehydrogenase
MINGHNKIRSICHREMKRNRRSPLAAMDLHGRALVVALFLLAGSSYLHAAAATPPVDGITAIYNFGDSISDTGNLIREQAAGLLEHIGRRCPMAWTSTGLPAVAPTDTS